MIGAKRPTSTLIHKIAVHPDHRRQGHGRHLLTSLSSKLSILGPPSMIAEVPETLAPACGLFKAGGYIEEALLTDYVMGGVGPNFSSATPSRDQNDTGRFVIPVSVDDLEANGLLEEADQQMCWERSVETLTARKDDISGLAVATDERIEAYVLFADRVPTAEIVSFHTFVEDSGARLRQLVAQLGVQGMRVFRFPKVHPSEISGELVEALGFRPAGAHRLFAARAQPA